MRVLHYEPAIRLELGGVVRAVLDIAAEQAKAGANVTLVTHDAKDVPSDFLERSKSFRAPGFLAGLAPAPLQPDHSVNKTMSSIFMALGLWPICSGLKSPSIGMCPYFVSPHGMLDDWCMEQKSLKKKLFLRFGGRRWLERASGVHLTATAEERQSKKWAPSMRSFVCPLPMDLGPFQEIPPHSLAASVEPAYAGRAPNCSVLVPPSRKKATRTLDRGRQGIEE